MAKYDVERSCGHVETVSLFGKVRDREWRLENIESQKLCYDCWQKQLAEEREKENKEAAEAAQEMNLPPITGSEKQIAWAETIRQKMLITIDDYIYTSVKKEMRNDPSLREAVEHIKNNKTEARWWIDNRYVNEPYKASTLIKTILKEIKEKQLQPPDEVIIEAKIESTVRPENPVTETVAEIRVIETILEIGFPEKRDDFRELVKSKLKMRWNGRCWSRKIMFKNGNVNDRAAEAGHLLLAEGFSIRVYDEQIRQNAINGKYEPEITRWIMARVKGKYKGWFSLSWDRDEDFYKVARRVAGSKYDRPNVVLPPEQFEQVLDFAQMYDFKLSPGALEIVNAAKDAKEKVLVVKVDKPKEKMESIIPDNKPPVLETPKEVGIDETLRDDD